MNTINHHLDDASLIALGAGTLDPKLALVATAHIELCAQCRERQRIAEQIGGALLLDQPPTSTAQNGFEKCWDLIHAGGAPAAASAAPPARGPAGGLPRVLSAFLPDDLDQVPWRRLTQRIEQFRLRGFDGGPGWVRLFRFMPGATVPSHGHQDGEMTLVLRGSYVDEIGRFGVGDLADLNGSDRHRPVVDSLEPCVALIASSGRVRFDSVLNRLGARILGL